MRIGQTSLLNYFSKLFGTVVGFVATVYFARVLGADGLGPYFLLMAVVAWLHLVGDVGGRAAVKKRISEGENQSKYLSAGLSVQVVLFLVGSVVIYLLRDSIDAYVGVSAAHWLILLFFAALLRSFVKAVLKGEHKVHVSALVQFSNQFSTSVFQVTLLVFGIGLSGLFLGYAMGSILAALVGMAFVSSHLERPRKTHFVSLYRYARYSWLGTIQGRTFSSMDIIVLGFFVTGSLISIYQIAWNIATMFALFGVSISQTTFPEISKESAEENLDSVAAVFEDSLAYAGLFLVPGLVGGALIGEDVLRIYGEEFTAGVHVLVILTVARLAYVYQSQFLNALNAIDRPDVAFRINAVFVSVNVVLNVVLVYRFGWVGAAVATFSSAVVSLVLGYRALSELIPVRIPYDEIGRQWVSAVVMALAVLPVMYVLAGTPVADSDIVYALVVSAVGGGAYFGMLLAISEQFKSVVNANLPAAITNWL